MTLLCAVDLMLGATPTPRKGMGWTILTTTLCADNDDAMAQTNRVSFDFIICPIRTLDVGYAYTS